MILLDFDDLAARAGVLAFVVVGGVDTFDSELETRRGVFPDLDPGGMVLISVGNLRMTVSVMVSL